MAIMSVKIIKIIDERKMCDTSCVVIRWSKSKV